MNNPRKYENVNSWVSGSTYLVTNLVNYDRDIFVYSGISSGTSSGTSSTPPVLDSGNWLKTNDWKEIDYEPVQTINEWFRTIRRLLSCRPPLRLLQTAARSPPGKRRPGWAGSASAIPARWRRFAAA